MFCPECKAEYREGFQMCADCNLSLVETLPDEQPPTFVEYEEVLTTYNAADVALIKSILDPESISYFFQGENFAIIRPLVEPARLMVRKDQKEEVTTLLGDLSIAYFAMRGGTDGSVNEVNNG